MGRIEEKSYGIIPLKKGEDEWLVLLIRHQAGHWAFPKGHPEKGESPKEAAARELTEETNLKLVEFLDEMPVQESYIFHREGVVVYKTVVYFLATVSGEVKLQEEELADYQWSNVSEAKTQITFPEGKNLCAEIEDRIRQLK